MSALRELLVVTRLAHAAVCVAANERAVAASRWSLKAALGAYDRALADLRAIECGDRAPPTIPTFLRRKP